MLVAHAAANALEWLGMPEARIPIAQAIIHIATAPKSNSVISAIDKAIDLVHSKGFYEVPNHLRDAHYPGAKNLNHGKGYKYPHDYPHHFVKQQYLPKGLEDVRLYTPSEQGREKYIKERMDFWKKVDS